MEKKGADPFLSLVRFLGLAAAVGIGFLVVVKPLPPASTIIVIVILVLACIAGGVSNTILGWRE